MIALLIIAALIVCGYLFVSAAVWHGLSAPPPYTGRAERLAVSLFWGPLAIAARYR